MLAFWSRTGEFCCENAEIQFLYLEALWPELNLATFSIFRSFLWQLFRFMHDAIRSRPLYSTACSCPCVAVVMNLSAPLTDDSTATLADLCGEWQTEVYLLANRVRLSGWQRRLSDLTTILPIDRAAIAALVLACEAESEGGLGSYAHELHNLLLTLANDPASRTRFLPALRKLFQRMAY
mgnify:CR=1 FL=1